MLLELRGFGAISNGCEYPRPGQGAKRAQKSRAGQAATHHMGSHMAANWSPKGSQASGVFLALADMVEGERGEGGRRSRRARAVLSPTLSSRCTPRDEEEARLSRLLGTLYVYSGVRLQGGIG